MSLADVISTSLKQAFNPAGVTARVVSVPAWASVLVANSTKPLMLVVAEGVAAVIAALTPAGVTARVVSVPVVASVVVANSTRPIRPSVAVRETKAAGVTNFAVLVPVTVSAAVAT